jgi:hypothetical protein
MLIYICSFGSQQENAEIICSDWNLDISIPNFSNGKNISIFMLVPDRINGT